MSPDEQVEKKLFHSMGKCGIGMACKFCRGTTDCSSIDNWQRIEIETSEICIKRVMKSYEFDLLGDYVHSPIDSFFL